MVRSGRGHPMVRHDRRSDRGDRRVRGVDHVHGGGGGLLGMEVGDRVREDLGEGPQRREVAGHGARMGQPRCLLKESKWAGPELRALGLAEEREVHGVRDLHAFRHVVGRAGRATGPKGCRSIHSIRSRGCR